MFLKYIPLKLVSHMLLYLKHMYQVSLIGIICLLNGPLV